jgi:protein-S-isoprenylcysteine O-methyltransferase Ste14
MTVIKLLVLLTILTVIYQIYSYAVTRQREEKQSVCRGLGICLFSIGVATLVTRDTVMVFTGIFLMMLGFRLIAHGLDRIDKKIFIDRFDESRPD